MPIMMVYGHMTCFQLKFIFAGQLNDQRVTSPPKFFIQIYTPAKYDGHVAGVTKSELICRLAYACQRGITLQKSDVDMNDVFDNFEDKEDQIMLQAGPIFSFLFIYQR